MNKLEYRIAVICMILVCAIISVSFAQYVELTNRENGTQGREILNIQSFPPNYIVFTCFGFDALANLQIDNRFENITPRLSLNIQFENCFNNATNHRNYQEFSLMNMIGQLNMNLSNITGLSIKNNEFCTVDSNIFFRDFDFATYNFPMLQNIQITNTTNLQNVQCCGIKHDNAGQVNFTDFPNNSIRVISLTEMNIKCFTQNNLAKFPILIAISLKNFQLDDNNTFNVPNLFRYNTQVYMFVLNNSQNRITLHEDIFLGLFDLTLIVLKKLKLKTLPKNIFQDLVALRSVNIMNNDVKHLDPDIFANNIDLQLLGFGDDEFLYSEELEYLKLGKDTKVFFDDVTVKDVKMLSLILKNPNLKELTFSKNSSIWNIDLLDLVRNTTRVKRLNIVVDNIPFRLNVSQIENQTNFSGPVEQFNQTNIFVSVVIKNSNWPNTNCVIDPELFMWYLDGKLNNLSIYFEQYKSAIKFQVATNLDYSYKILFNANCSEKCKCYHNPLLDDVYIDCTGQNLRSIPIIPYPSQFTTIARIELNLEDNLITDIHFDMQDVRVQQKITFVVFDNNPVLRVNLTENVAQLNYFKYCYLFFGNLVRSETTIYIYGKNTTIANNLCGIGVTNSTYLENYFRAKTKQQIKDVLDATMNNATCSMNY